MYAKIEKIQKKFLYYIFLPSVLVTLIKNIYFCKVEKARFLSNYQLRKIYLNYLEIMQLYCYMEYSKFYCLDLQFISPLKAKKAKNIQKNFIFLNSVNEI